MSISDHHCMCMFLMFMFIKYMIYMFLYIVTCLVGRGVLWILMCFVCENLCEIIGMKEIKNIYPQGVNGSVFTFIFVIVSLYILYEMYTKDILTIQSNAHSLNIVPLKQYMLVFYVFLSFDFILYSNVCAVNLSFKLIFVEKLLCANHPDLVVI